MIWLYIILYILIASACIFGLLVAAEKHTDLEWPWMYIVCGILWPVAALPSAAYIAAAWYINREEDETDGKRKEDLH